MADRRSGERERETRRRDIVVGKSVNGEWRVPFEWRVDWVGRGGEILSGAPSGDASGW